MMGAMASSTRDVFAGRILGIGSTSGVRVVVGMWDASPLGAFADCMVAAPDGLRTLLAPSPEVAAYVGDTYRFDEVRVERVGYLRTSDSLAVQADSLSLSVALGDRTGLGWLLQAVPTPVRRAPWFATACDPVARAVLRGVRTRGTAGNGRTELYAAADVRSVRSASGSFDRTDLGRLADVWPEPGFGFSSTPRSPALTTVTTTVLR